MIAVAIAGTRWGLPVARVGTVFHIEHVTRIPRAPAHLVGLFNLRSKIVPVVSLQRHVDPRAPVKAAGSYAIGIEHAGESYALLIDTVGDVIAIREEDRIETPRHGQPALLALTTAVYQTSSGLLPILDIPGLLSPPNPSGAAGPSSSKELTS